MIRSLILLLILGLTGCSGQALQSFASGYVTGSALYYQTLPPPMIVCTQFCSGPTCTTVCQ